MMRQPAVWSFFVFLTICTSLFASSGPSTVTIGFIPGDDPEVLKKNGVELARVLQQKLGTNFNIYISKDYSSLIEAMREKKIDFAFYSAATFVEAEKKAGAKILLKKVYDGPFYYSVILTTKQSRLNSVEGLKGKKIGFVDPQSASGHLYPLVMLKKKGIKPEEFFKEIKFFGNHEATAKALLDGQVDAVAVYSNDKKGEDGPWRKLESAKDAALKILWVSDPIPNDPFCVRQDFYDKYPRFTHDLMFSLIDFTDEPQGGNILKRLYGISSLQLATSRQYDPVREMVRLLDSGSK